MRTRFDRLGRRGGRAARAAGAAAAAVLLPGAWAAAAPLTNGNFEAGTNADNSTNTFLNWAENAAGTAVNSGNVAVRATTALAGSTSARLTGTGGQAGTQIGTLSQTVDPISGAFNLSFALAAVDPGGATPSTANRSFQLLLTGANGAQINLIVIRGSSTSVGTVQLFGTAFTTPTNLADRINFSTSLASPVVNTLTLAGTVGGSYTVTANGTTSAPVSLYQAGTAATPTDFTSVNFTTVNAATVGYVVDNVAFVPEPASAGLLGAVALAGLTRRTARRPRR